MLRVKVRCVTRRIKNEAVQNTHAHKTASVVDDQPFRSRGGTGTGTAKRETETVGPVREK